MSKKKHDPADQQRAASRDGERSKKLSIKVWTCVVGDAGLRWRGCATLGAHSFGTEVRLSRTAALVEVLGLVAAHIACVAVRHGDDA